MTLYNKDCFKIFPTLKSESIDLILVDPPYGTTSIDWDKPLDYKRMWVEFGKIIKPLGLMILFGSQPFTSFLICSKSEWFKYELIWNKNKAGNPGLAKHRPLKVHENILIFSKKSGAIYNPQMEIGEPFTRISKDPEGYQSRCNTHGYGFKPLKSIVNTGTRYPKSILNISRDFSAQQQIHPTQKPVPLMEYLIKTYSNPGDTVLDCCMGSGTTGVACVNTERNFIGIEKDIKYFEIAKKRIKEATPKLNFV